MMAIMFEGQAQWTVCPFKLLTHLPCPGCGTTRGVLLLLHGDIIKGFLTNPNSIFACLFIFLFPVLFLIDIASNKAHLYEIYLRCNRILQNPWAWLLITTYLFLIWGHNIYIGN